MIIAGYPQAIIPVLNVGQIWSPGDVKPTELPRDWLPLFAVGCSSGSTAIIRGSRHGKLDGLEAAEASRRG